MNQGPGAVATLLNSGFITIRILQQRPAEYACGHCFSILNYYPFVPYQKLENATSQWFRLRRKERSDTDTGGYFEKTGDKS